IDSGGLTRYLSDALLSYLFHTSTDVIDSGPSLSFNEPISLETLSHTLLLSRLLWALLRLLLSRKYNISLDLHPGLPPNEAIVLELPNDMIAIYHRMFDFSWVRIPFSFFCPSSSTSRSSRPSLSSGSSKPFESKEYFGIYALEARIFGYYRSEASFRQLICFGVMGIYDFLYLHKWEGSKVQEEPYHHEGSTLQRLPFYCTLVAAAGSAIPEPTLNEHNATAFDTKHTRSATSHAASRSAQKNLSDVSSVDELPTYPLEVTRARKTLILPMLKVRAEKVFNFLTTSSFDLRLIFLTSSLLAGARTKDVVDGRVDTPSGNADRPQSSFSVDPLLLVLPPLHQASSMMILKGISSISCMSLLC
nr:hypothetical protein [Tanacetum cinerariifolium]